MFHSLTPSMGPYFKIR